jgi:hypothetical protein
LGVWLWHSLEQKHWLVIHVEHLCEKLGENPQVISKLHSCNDAARRGIPIPTTWRPITDLYIMWVLPMPVLYVLKSAPQSAMRLCFQLGCVGPWFDRMGLSVLRNVLYCATQLIEFYSTFCFELVRVLFWEVYFTGIFFPRAF